MTKKTKAHPEKEPAVILDTLVGNIRARLKKVDDYRVSAAILIHEAHELVVEGAAGEGVKWSEWASKKFKIGYREVKRLTHIGAAPSPKAAMEDYRGAEAKRMRELREKRKAAIAEETRKLPEAVEDEPPEFNEADFVLETEGGVRTPPACAPPVADDEDVDGLELITERMDEMRAERLRIWNQAVRSFVSLSPGKRRAFVKWACTMCVWREEDAPTAKDLGDIPAFLRRA